MKLHQTGKLVYGSRPTKRPRRTKVEISALRSHLYAILQEFNPMTDRQLFYQAETRGVIEKTEREYKNVIVRLLVKMRVEDEIPFDWIADNTRWMRKGRSYSSMEEALRECARTYRLNLWDNPDAYVEVWTEKDALAGVLMEETDPWDVPRLSRSGFTPWLVNQLRDFPVGQYTDGPDALHQAVTLLAHLMGQCPGIVPRPA